MGERIKCFWIEPTELAQSSLRRFRYSQSFLKKENGDTDFQLPDPNYYKCSNGFGCDASVIIGNVPFTEEFGTYEGVDKTDLRWPTACDTCGRHFEDINDDQWQRNERRLYKRSDNGELITLRNLPAGAMYDAPWWRPLKNIKQRPDGITLVVMTPDGEWCVDGGSSNGNGWERSGTIPNITATPSIICGKYHGWLRDGWLEEC